MEIYKKGDGFSISAEHKLMFPAAAGKSGDSQHIFHNFPLKSRIWEVTEANNNTTLPIPQF